MLNKIPTVTFRNESINNIMLGLEMDSVQQVIYDRLIPNLKTAIDKNKKEVVFCYVQEYDIVIPKKSYENTLKTLEKYYLIKEDYERCSIIRDLLIKVKDND